MTIRNEKPRRGLLLSLMCIFLALPLNLNSATESKDLSSYELWITGDIYTEVGELLFRADKPVRGNQTGKVVLLGVTKQTKNVLIPLYLRASEKHSKMRLYGILLPVAEPVSTSSPSVEFITWKMHDPSDPNDLPSRDKIIIREGDTVKGDIIYQHPK